MPSTTVIVTSITSFLGFLLNTTIMVLILLRGRKLYHYLFATILFLCAVWDLGTFLIMIRNTHENELVIYGYLISVPGIFFSVLFYHFTGAYLGQVKKKTTTVLWVLSVLSFIIMASGLLGKISGVYHYRWGNLFRPDETLLLGILPSIPLYYFTIGASIYFLSRAYKKEPSPVTRRHMLYISASLVALGLALIKIIALYNVDNPALLPFGMALNDIFAALIGIAIIKEQLFDITVVVKIGTIYSILAALVVFIFSFSEHLLATYFSKLVGEHSTVMHLISIGVVIAVLMPVKNRLEHTVNRFFAQKQLQF
jgi:hypothetical protein